MDRYDAQGIINRLVGEQGILRVSKNKDPKGAAEYEGTAVRTLEEALARGELWITTSETVEHYKARTGIKVGITSTDPKNNLAYKLSLVTEIRAQERKYAVVFDASGWGRALDRDEIIDALDAGVPVEIVHANAYEAVADEDRCASGPEGFYKGEDGVVHPYNAATALLSRLLEPLSKGMTPGVKDRGHNVVEEDPDERA